MVLWKIPMPMTKPIGLRAQPTVTLIHAASAYPSTKIICTLFVISCKNCPTVSQQMKRFGLAQNKISIIAR
ncbi:hypothetical protein AB9N12_14140 [Bacteroides sp. AN502(2024)]